MAEEQRREALVGNAGDEQDVRRGGRLERRRRERELADLRTVLASAEGRRVLWRLLQEFGIDRCPYNPSGRGDSTVFAAGAQNAALWLKAEIKQAGGLEAWLLLERDAAAREKAEAAENLAGRTRSAEEAVELTS